MAIVNMIMTSASLCVVLVSLTEGHSEATVSKHFMQTNANPVFKHKVESRMALHHQMDCADVCLTQSGCGGFKHNKTTKTCYLLVRSYDNSVPPVNIKNMFLDTDFSADFMSATVYNFAVGQPTTANYLNLSHTLNTIPLSQMTICVSLRLLASTFVGAVSNYKPTIISYSNNVTYNAIWMYVSATQIALNIGKTGSSQDAARLDINIADNSWYQVCVTWRTSGFFAFYINGEKRNASTTTSNTANLTIAPGGILTIGQEQDSLGGSFQSVQAYPGEISALYIWDRALADEEFTESFGCLTAASLVNWHNSDTFQVFGNVTMAKRRAC